MVGQIKQHLTAERLIGYVLVAIASAAGSTLFGLLSDIVSVPREVKTLRTDMERSTAILKQEMDARNEERKKADIELAQRLDAQAVDHARIMRENAYIQNKIEGRKP